MGARGTAGDEGMRGHGMAGETPAGWYDDGSGDTRWWDGSTWTENVQPVVQSPAPAPPPLSRDQRASATGPAYVVVQTVLKEKFVGTGSGNLTELENAINAQAARGYRLHTITTAASGSKGLGGGDRIQATMVFERLGS